MLASTKKAMNQTVSLKAIRYLIYDSGLSDEQIANKVGLTRQSIYLMKMNKTSLDKITLENAIKLSDYGKILLEQREGEKQ